MSVVTIGLDLAKTVFQVHGVDAGGITILRRKLVRADMIAFFTKQPPCLVGALMLEQNDEWAVSRRYMTLETIGSVSHNPVVSLPALAA